MNEVIVPVTPIMKLKAFNQATFMKNRSGNKIQQYGKVIPIQAKLNLLIMLL